MSDLHRALARAALAEPDEIEYAYWSAVAEGAADTRSSPEQERSLGTLRLLTLATLRLPDLALQASLLDLGDHGSPDAVDIALDAACETGAGALRLAHRALEAHAAAIDYEVIAWMSHGHGRARTALAQLEPALVEGGTAVTYGQVRRITVALTRATAATADDVLRVPDEIATALGHLLALYMVTNEAISA